MLSAQNDTLCGPPLLLWKLITSPALMVSSDGIELVGAALEDHVHVVSGTAGRAARVQPPAPPCRGLLSGVAVVD